MAAAGTFDMKWLAQPRQMKFLRACGLAYAIEGGKPRRPCAKIIGYGGAAGGGKSDALLMAAIIYCVTYKKAKVGYFRRTYAQLNGPGGAVMRSMELLTGFAKYNEGKHRWKFPNGSIIQFCYLDKEKDVFNYQSQMFDCIMFDEATQFTYTQVTYMQSRIRSVKGYPTWTGMATNPGGIGHSWFKTHFVKAGEEEIPHRVEVEPGKFRTHMFIPSRLTDNLILMEMDPTYKNNLENLPEMLRKQLLEGDWDVAEGMAFTEWRDHVHVIPPFKIPDEWVRFRSLDWGYVKPFAVGWYAVDHDGRIYKYRELYGWGGKENTGSKESPAEVARKIIKLEKGETIKYAVADDAIFGGKQDHSLTVAEQFANAFGQKAIHWERAGKGPGSRKAGKMEMHHRLRWTPEEPEPMLLFFNTCRHTIRTLPNMILDETDPEDIDTDLEDHIYDETRYAMSSRPITPKKKPRAKTKIEEHKERKTTARGKGMTRRAI